MSTSEHQKAARRHRARVAFCAPRTCSLEGCDRVHEARGYCSMHYQRVLQGLDPLEERKPHSLPVGHRRKDGQGYIYVRVGAGVWKGEHRLVMEQVLGRELRRGESAHHKNGVRDDNREENLELWVSPPRHGQRVEDLVRWIVEQYPDQVADALRGDR